MKYAKILALGGVIAVVAATAILVPSIASGDVFTPPGLSQIATEDSDSPDSDSPDTESPGNGNGKAWGHHKDSDDFPGNNGNENGNENGEGKADGNGNGKAWGHNKDSEDFPGNNGNENGNGHGRDKEDKPGKSENSDD